MIATRNGDKQKLVADILLDVEATLQEVRQYYKFERHEGTSPDKLYFLFSQCAHLLYSIWLAKNQWPARTFEQNLHLNAFVAGLDFGELQQSHCSERVLHVDADGGYLKNLSIWFSFWLRALKEQGRAKATECDDFSQHVLSYVSEPGFLEGKVARRKRKALADLVKRDAVARLLHHSAAILQGLTSAIVLQLTSLDQSFHTAEQIASLVCMLRQVRRTIIHETPARGPYVLLSNPSWGIPSTLFRLYPGRCRQGTLKVVPRRDGAGIACTYRWTAGSQPATRSWTQPTSALSHTYEQELFRTWSYDTGNHLADPGSFTDLKAHWLLQSVEAKRLRIIFHHVETILRTLAVNSRCASLIEEVTRVLMDGQVEWRASKLEWTYIKKLDQLLKTLNTAYWEARLLGGRNPGEEVIAIKWPPQLSTGSRVEPSSLRGPRSNERLQSSLPPKNTILSKSENSLGNAPVEGRLPQKKPIVTEQRRVNAPADREPGQHTASADGPSPTLFPTSRVRVDQQGQEGARQPQDATGSRNRNERNGLEQANECRLDMHQGKRRKTTNDLQANTTDQQTKSRPSFGTVPSSDRQEEVRQNGMSISTQTEVSGLHLIRKLRERHQPGDGSVNYNPLSLKQLQQELGWTQAAVQRMMTNVFGRRPFTVYKQKCRDKTICDFLADAGGSVT